MRLKELESWLTPADVAKVEGITRQGVHKRLQDGRYRAIKTRLGYLIDPESVEHGDTGDSTRETGVEE